jgi:hypothetical protein
VSAWRAALAWPTPVSSMFSGLSTARDPFSANGVVHGLERCITQHEFPITQGRASA